MKKLWQENYENAKVYSANHGGLVFNSKGLSEEELKLRQWVYSQRFKGNNGKLSEDKMQLLEDIGMIWNPAEEAWEKAFEIAKKYIEENGHCSPPKKLIIDGVNLNNWFTTQRDFFKNGKLSASKIDKLNSIGMIWRVQSESWEYHFELFKQYVMKTGSVLIEDLYETKDGVRLGQWIGQQRKDFKCGRISAERIRRLEEVGMVWDVYDLMWRRMFSLAKEYYEIYGDLLVPHDYVIDNENLGLWIKNQRIDYRNGCLPQSRIDELNKIDMVWDGKCISGTSFPEQVLLYYFSKYFPDTIHRCKESGFEFDIYISSIKVAVEYDGAVWHKKKKTIEKDLQKNEFCKNSNIVLYRIRELPLPHFSNCNCYSITHNRYDLIENVIYEILNTIGIISIDRTCFNVKKNFHDIHKLYKHHSSKSWRDGLHSAKTYYSQNGHLIVPTKYVDENGFRLGQWLNVQRINYNKNELPQKDLNN